MSNQELNPAILMHLQRLGAIEDKKMLEEYKTIGTILVPYPINRLLAYRFPKKTKYYTPEDAQSFSARFVEFNIRNSFHEGDSLYIVFGICGGGNYSLAINLNDSNPSNPYVHKLDSEDMSGSDGADLSLFLADLQEQKSHH